MKIALISHLFPTELHPFQGKFIKDQLTLLNSDENIQADIVVPTPYSIPFTTREKKNKSSLLADDFKNNRLKYLSFPKKKFPATISRSLSRNIQRYFHDKKYDVIHVHWLYPDALCIPALKKMGFKCVLTIHGSDWYQNTDNLVLMDIFEKVLDSTDRVLYSGPLLKRDVERVFPWLSKKSALIYNYVDTNIYTKPTYLEKEKAIEKLGWNPQKINVLTVANIRHEKGIDLLLDAVAETEQFAGIDFHIIGALDSDDYGKLILERVKSAPNQNVILHSPVPPADLISYYHSADFYLLPSRREGFNVSILEAMSTGLPVVSTPVGGTDIIIDSETGILAPAISEVGVKKGLISILEALPNLNADVIRKRVQTKFGKETYLERLLKYYI